jgi:hypothetical protein
VSGIWYTQKSPLIVKTVLRNAPLIAGMLFPLVLLAFLDQIPDNPGELKQRQFQQNRAFQIAPQFDPKARIATFVPWTPRSFQFPDLVFHFDVESTNASAGTSDLRFAADSSPPAST